MKFYYMRTNKFHKLVEFHSYSHFQQKFSQFEMESLGLVQYSSNKPGSRLQVTADLVTFQRDLFSHRGVDTRFNVGTKIISLIK